MRANLPLTHGLQIVATSGAAALGAAPGALTRMSVPVAGPESALYVSLQKSVQWFPDAGSGAEGNGRHAIRGPELRDGWAGCGFMGRCSGAPLTLHAGAVRTTPLVSVPFVWTSQPIQCPLAVVSVPASVAVSRYACAFTACGFGAVGAGWVWPTFRTWPWSGMLAPDLWVACPLTIGVPSSAGATAAATRTRSASSESAPRRRRALVLMVVSHLRPERFFPPPLYPRPG